MNLYEVYYNPDEEIHKVILVKASFSLTAAIFNFLWAAYQGIWTLFILGIIINIVLSLQVTNPFISNLQCAMQIAIFLFLVFLLMIY